MAIWAALTVYYIITQPALAPVSPSAPAAGPDAPFAGLRAADVMLLEIDWEGRRIHAEQRDGRWRLTAPAHKQVPGDLVSALVTAVLDLPEVEVIPVEPTRYSEFGLAEPAARLVFERHDGTRVTVALGAHNPTDTAIYARREETETVMLLGLNTEYYLRLLLRGALALGE